MPCAASCSTRSTSRNGTPRRPPTTASSKPSRRCSRTTSDPKRRGLAAAIGTLDEQQLNPAENRVLKRPGRTASPPPASTSTSTCRFASGRWRRSRRSSTRSCATPRRAPSSSGRSWPGPQWLMLWLAGVGLTGCLGAAIVMWRTTAGVTRRIASAVETLTERHAPDQGRGRPGVLVGAGAGPRFVRRRPPRSSRPRPRWPAWRCSPATTPGTRRTPRR